MTDTINLPTVKFADIGDVSAAAAVHVRDRLGDAYLVGMSDDRGPFSVCVRHPSGGYEITSWHNSAAMARSYAAGLQGVLTAWATLALTP